VNVAWQEAPSKSPPKGETFKKCFKALSFGEGWVRLLAALRNDILANCWVAIAKDLSADMQRVEQMLHFVQHDHFFTYPLSAAGEERVIQRIVDRVSLPAFIPTP
jgi:hypothetical protein